MTEEEWKEKITYWTDSFSLMGDEEYSQTKKRLLNQSDLDKDRMEFLKSILELADMKREDRRAREKKVGEAPVQPVWNDYGSVF